MPLTLHSMELELLGKKVDSIELGPAKYKMSLGHLAVPESNKCSKSDGNTPKDRGTS